MWSRNILGSLFLIFAMMGTAHAQDAGWRFVVQPYALVPAMNGTAGVGPFNAEVDVSRRDVIDNLNIAYLGYFEVGKGPWAFGVDVNYMNLDSSPNLRRIQTDIGQKAVQPMVFYKLDDSLELMAGVRYNRIDLSLSTDLQLINGINRERDWVDPIVGVRYSHDIGKRSSFSLLTNIGGFGVASDAAFQFRPIFHYKLSNSIDVDAGYQFFYMDYEEGNGARRFAYDVWTHGPIVGMSFRF